MFWQTIDKAGRVIGPVLIHFLAANLIGMLGLRADAAFLTSITAVLVLPLFIWMYRQDCRIREGREARDMKPADQLLVAALGVACNLLFTVLMNLLMKAAQLSNTAQEALFGSAFFVQLIGLGILVPVMEEVLFRGLVYNRLKGYTKRVWSAAVLSAAVFAVYHGNLVQTLFAFPMALLITAVYERWHTLKAPVLFHMAVNVSSILWQII